MTETRFYEPARLSTPPKPLLSLKPLDANLVKVIILSKVFRFELYHGIGKGSHVYVKFVTG